jgi:hypothetical protein
MVDRDLMMTTDWFRGLRAGVKLGPVLFVVELAMTLLYTEVVLAYLGYSFSWGNLGQLSLWLVGDAIVFMVIAIGMGLLYARLEGRIPGDSDPARAMVLFVPVWSLFTIAQALLITSTTSMEPPHYRTWVMLLVLLSVPYGYLLGWLWEREEPTDF